MCVYPQTEIPVPAQCCPCLNPVSVAAPGGELDWEGPLPKAGLVPESGVLMRFSVI